MVITVGGTMIITMRNTVVITVEDAFGDAVEEGNRWSGLPAQEGQARNFVGFKGEAPTDFCKFLFERKYNLPWFF